MNVAPRLHYSTSHDPYMMILDAYLNSSTHDFILCKALYRIEVKTMVKRRMETSRRMKLEKIKALEKA